jgi:hypothetical protein
MTVINTGPTWAATQTEDVTPVQFLSDAEIAAGNYRLLQREPWHMRAAGTIPGGAADLTALTDGPGAYDLDKFLKSTAAGWVWGTVPAGNRAAALVDASGDGDYTTLALALAGGATFIALKPGSYSGAVTVTQDDITIVGYGALWAENTAGPTFTVSGARVHFEGISFYGTHDGDEADMIGSSVILATGQGVTTHKCHYINLRGYAVQADGADDIEIDHCYAENVATAASPAKYTRYCFYVTNGSLRANVHHNYVTGWSQAIGFWYGTSDSTAERNTLINNCGHEAGAARRSAMEDFGDSVQNERNKWLCNTVDGTTSNCMELAQGLKGTLVQGNTFKNSGLGYTTNAAPIFVTGGDGGAGGEANDGVQIIANRIYGRNDAAVEDGCGAIGLIDGVLWQDNEFYDFLNTTATLFIQSSAQVTQKVKIRGNMFRNVGNASGYYVIRLQVDKCVVEDNDIVSVFAATRGIYADGSDGHVIEDNDITVVNKGIMVDNDSRVINNTIISEGEEGIRAGARNEILHNTVTNPSSWAGGVHCITLTGNGNEVHDNRLHITDVAGAEVILATGESNKFHRNYLTHAANGGGAIELGAASTFNIFSDNTYVQPDNLLSINDLGAGNRVENNHTLIALGS